MALLRNIALTPEKNLLTDVENRSVYSLSHCELNVFETYRTSEMVALTFNDAVITSMVRGKKIMHLPGVQAFDYFPGETVLAPAGTKMEIDFPLAKQDDPTQCIALTLENNYVNTAIEYLNSYFPRNTNGWHLNYHQLHMRNSNALADAINKLVIICREGNLTKDILADLTLKELIVRLVQLQALEQIPGEPSTANVFAYVTHYIRNHIGDKLNVDELSRKAYMSRASFFRLFKREYGISPVRYITRERIHKAKALLSATNMTVNQVGLESGFEDVNHFIRTFKQSEGVTPAAYRNKLCQNTSVRIITA